MSRQIENIDVREINKFQQMKDHWWQADGPLKTLHVINPVRLKFVRDCVDLNSKKILDVGCGGGIFSEALAETAKHVTGLDLGEESLQVAREHAADNNISNIEYVKTTVESYAVSSSSRFDVISCMEMLEHVPEPESIIQSCRQLLKPGGSLFLSTLNRHPLAYCKAILAAEHILEVLPPGTHDYARFIKPHELARLCRKAGLQVNLISGLNYLPFLDKAYMSHKTDTNYMMHVTLPA